MLKKPGIILVTLLYLVTATGFVMNLHFCGKNIASVGLNKTAEECGMSSKCCKNTHLEVKVKDAHQTAHTVFSSINLALPVAVVRFHFLDEGSTINHLTLFSAERGPPLNGQVIFLKNQNFRI
ncbi:HYC_CC_PP family protein [Mucilaginibacter sp.]|uniref:HYC_CC_PP family protein n=1 Tax=Mucilaginibacter sp. TaxID=1882438 RepID=UPI003B002C86